jgi:hypothetical protein
VLVLLIGTIVVNISEEGGDGDSDGDGIIDRYDECPNTPNGENVDPEGCSDSQSDTDGDGVSDRDDECPDTPEGEEVYEDGCSASQTPGFSFLLAITSLVIVSFLFYKKQD